MSQFKKNPKKLEQILNEQFLVDPNEQDNQIKHKSNLEEFEKTAYRINNNQY